ncbi:MAG: hypothetical protein QRY72_03990 [Candidatus Rhabdochlamydia sp.]
MQEVRLHGAWETWLEFFLQGITFCAKQATHTAHQINTVFDHDFQKITTLKRARFSCQQLFHFMKQLPQVTVSTVVNHLQMTAPTARSALNHMVTVGILEEVSGKARDKTYVYRNYLDLLEAGTEPFPLTQ